MSDLILTPTEVDPKAKKRRLSILRKQQLQQKKEDSSPDSAHTRLTPSLDLIPRVTIHPTKICLYKEVNWVPVKRSGKFDSELLEEAGDVNQSFLRSARRNNGFLSIHAKRKMDKSVDYLLSISDRKKIYSTVQQKYITYRIVFVTLTLPSKQVHTDKDITNLCLNQLFVELSKYHGVKYYIWRAEKQQNGNIHYHILINQFVEWSVLRKRWNRILNKLGYVDRYQAYMKKFYEKGFRLTNHKLDKRTEEQQRKAYIIGQKSDWTSPNSTDIHDTRNVTDIKAYISKYMSKQPDVDLNSDNLEESTLIVNGRLWSCSQNLSDIKGCQLVEDWSISDELQKVAENSGCKIYTDTYFSVMFVDAKKLKQYGSEKLFLYFAEYLLNQFDYHSQISV